MAEHIAPITEDSHLYLIDASGYIFRAFHALPPLTRPSDGLPVGAVQGFCNMLWKLLEELKGDDRPTHFACIFDKGSYTFRNDLYPEYKAQRPPPPEDLRPQFPLIRDAAIAFGTPALEMEGYEADDLIATYARQAEAAGARVTIVSSDKDLMQLVSDKITLLDTMKNKRLSFAEVEEKFGVGPDKVIDVQSLAGDSVDNVPGAPGIGIKTAAQLIHEYGDVLSLLERAEEIKQPKRRQTLIDNVEQIKISRELVTLKTDVPVEAPIETLKVRDPDPATLINFLEAMEFRTITRRVKEAFEAEGELPEDKEQDGVDYSRYETVTTEKQLNDWVQRCQKAGIIAVDTETDALDQVSSNLVGISISVRTNEACYIPIGHKSLPDGELDLGNSTNPDQLPLAKVIEVLKPVLEDTAILKVGQNFKYDLAVLSRYGVEVAPYDDTMLQSFCLHAGMHGHGMDELSERYFGHTPISFKDVCGTGKKQITFDLVPLDKATPYAAEDADITLRLWYLFRDKLIKQKVSTVYQRIERPLPAVISKMELAGIRVDRDALSRMSSDFAQRMAGYEAEAYEQAGREFNMGSPKQLGEILFDEMGLPGGKKTKTGAWSTDASQLEELAAAGHDLPQTIINWRTLSKLKSTYADALQTAINKVTGRVHTSFSLSAAQTGRLSSTDPNLQNIPIRTEEGRKIRSAFIAEPGNVLVSADYSQIELRLLAHIADIDALKTAFKDGLDIHAMTASEMFGEPIEGMDPMTRRKAKAINFGIIYGISAYGLSNQLGIPQGEARDYIKEYFKKFPGIRDYMDKTKEFAKDHKYAETIYGRKCWVQGIAAKNPAQRQFAERQAINAPIQGSAADIIKRAMIAMPNALHQAGLKGKMLLQVHDELIFECPESEAETLISVVKSTMSKATEPALKLSVPMDVEAEAAKNWAEAH